MQHSAGRCLEAGLSQCEGFSLQSQQSSLETLEQIKLCLSAARLQSDIQKILKRIQRWIIISIAAERGQLLDWAV